MNSPELIIIRTAEQIWNLYETLKDKPLIAIDTETTGVDLASTLS